LSQNQNALGCAPLSPNEKPVVIVVSPLVALMEDQVKETTCVILLLK